MGKAREANKIKHLEMGQEERLTEEKQQKIVRGRVDGGEGCVAGRPLRVLRMPGRGGGRGWAGNYCIVLIGCQAQRGEVTCTSHKASQW